MHFKFVRQWLCLNLLHECETWTITRKTDSNLQASEMKLLRAVNGYTKEDQTRNEDV